LRRRSYLLAEVGGRMDIIRSRCRTSAGAAVSQRLGLAQARNRQIPITGATGSILNSNIHDNYFGQYSPKL
jgi:hypothetical protein